MPQSQMFFFLLFVLFHFVSLSELKMLRSPVFCFFHRVEHDQSVWSLAEDDQRRPASVHAAPVSACVAAFFAAKPAKG